MADADNDWFFDLFIMRGEFSAYENPEEGYVDPENYEGTFCEHGRVVGMCEKEEGC